MLQALAGEPSAARSSADDPVLANAAHEDALGNAT